MNCGGIAGLPAGRIGKVREVFDLGDVLLIVASDRISAFDVVMANGVPDKGRILNQMSLFWFEKLRHIAPHHVIASSDEALKDRVPSGWETLSGRSILAKKAKPLPIECVARGYLSGGGTKEYAATGSVSGISLPAGFVEGSKLDEPIFTPATKAEEGHDQNISWDTAVDLVGREIAELARDWTLKLYKEAAAHAAQCGLILADTKFEFGLTDDGLLWIDEALTPDSSRYWESTGWNPGQAQPSFDKQFVRDYLESIQWNKQPPGPTLPEDIIAKTREKYLDAYRRIVGKSLDVHPL